MPRTAPALLALVIVLTACGENSIERAGQGSTGLDRRCRTLDAGDGSGRDSYDHPTTTSDG